MQASISAYTINTLDLFIFCQYPECNHWVIHIETCKHCISAKFICVIGHEYSSDNSDAYK